MQIILTYGCNDAVTSYNETSATVTINDESVVFNFTNGQLVPVTSAWQQGSTPMFFYRTVNDGSSDVTVVCTPDGKLYVDDNDNYIKRVNDGFGWSTGAASQTLITNCGGKVAMDEAAGDDNLMTVISMNDYTVVFNEDGDVTVGAIQELTPLFSIPNEWHENPSAVIVDKQGRLVTFQDDFYKAAFYLTEQEKWNQGSSQYANWQGEEISVEITKNGSLWTFELDGITCTWNSSELTLSPTPAEYE